MAAAAARPAISAMAMENVALAPVLVELVAAGLERPTDVARDFGLRQLEPAFARHVGDDPHVVLRPRHGLRAPFGERVVRRATDSHRLAPLITAVPMQAGGRAH